MSELYEPTHELPLSLYNYPIRVGSKLGRTLYLRTEPGEKATDVFLGVVETPELAQEIMNACNVFYGLYHQENLKEE